MDANTNVANFPQTQTDDDQDRGETGDSGEVRDVGGIAGQRLQSFLERIERLQEEKDAIAEDMKEVYAEAKGVGFDTGIMRRIIKLRKMEPEKRREEDDLLDLYMSAIGMV